MIRILWNAFLLAVIALVAAWLSNNAGTVEIQWVGYRIKTSVGLLIGAAALVYFVFHYCLSRPLSMIGAAFASRFASDARAERIAKNKVAKEMDRYVLLAKGMTALSAGDVASAEKMQKQISKKFEDDVSKTTAFEAQLAEARNELPKALALYSELTKIPETRLLGMRGVIRLNRLTGNLSAALDACKVLLDEKDSPSWVVSEAFELQIQEKRWNDALSTLEKGRKQGVFDKKTARHLKACVLLEEANCTEDATEKERLVHLAADADETLMQASLGVAQYNIQKGQIRKARSILFDLWKKSPCMAVYETYLELYASASPIDVVKSVEELIAENPETVLNQYVLADSSFRAHLWGQAKTSVEKYLEVCPNSKKALLLAAEIAENDRDEKAAADFRERASLAETEAPYRCGVCHTEFSEWHTVCPVCRTLGATGLAA